MAGKEKVEGSCMYVYSQKLTDNVILTAQVNQTTYLYFLKLIIYFGLSLFNLGHFLSHLPFYLFHFCLLVTGILDNQKYRVIFIVMDCKNSLQKFHILK